MADLIQFRRDTSANWASSNPVLAQGELGLETNTTKYKIGDGTTAWNSLPYGALSGAVGALDIQEAPTPPTAPVSGISLYAGSIAGRMMPRYVGPSGIDTALQPLLARNKIGYWCPPGNSSTIPGVLGFTAYTAVGTATARNVSTANMFTRMRRLGYVSAASAGSIVSTRVAAGQVALGDESGLGGFFKVIRFGISDLAEVEGARMFVGMSFTTSAPTNVEPSTLASRIGVGHGSSDTNLKIFYGGTGTSTPIDLGPNFPITHGSENVYELAMFSPPNENGIVILQVTRLNTGHTAVATLGPSNGINLPLPSVLLSYSWNYRTNNGTALAVGLDIMSDYIETDY